MTNRTSSSSSKSSDSSSSSESTDSSSSSESTDSIPSSESTNSTSSSKSIDIASFNHYKLSNSWDTDIKASMTAVVQSITSLTAERNELSSARSAALDENNNLLNHITKKKKSTKKIEAKIENFQEDYKKNTFEIGREKRRKTLGADDEVKAALEGSALERAIKKRNSLAAELAHVMDQRDHLRSTIHTLIKRPGKSSSDSS